jgi:hypothetical protein
MSLRRFVPWIVGFVLLISACTQTSHRASETIPTVTPTATCWIYGLIYNPEPFAYLKAKLSSDEISYIEMQIRQVPQGERRLVRWMRYPYPVGTGGQSLLVFIETPLYSHGGYSPWDALNTNVLIDPKDCSVHAYPKA